MTLSLEGRAAHEQRIVRGRLEGRIALGEILRVQEDVGLDLVVRVATRLLGGAKGLHGVGDKLPGDLSGGQGQRVAIARALVGRPQVVFADEPTGSLDSVASDQVMELLVDVAKAERAGVVIVTHEARIAAFADRRITLRDGTAVSVATTRYRNSHLPR